MIRFLKIQRGLLLILLIHLSLVPYLFAQSGTKGNIIKGISISKRGNKYILNIKGVLDPAKISKLQIKPGPRPKSFIITIPDSLVDPETITSPKITFRASDPLVSIRIEEAIKEVKGTDDVMFQVRLVVMARKEFKTAMISPASRSLVRIGLEDAELLKQQALKRERELARKKAQAEKKKLAEQEKLARNKLKDQKNQIDEKRMSKAKQKVGSLLKHYKRPTLMQVSILNGSGVPKRAYKLSVFLGRMQQKLIEETLGMRLDIINISNAPDSKTVNTTIYFRENFLKSALFLANLIPGDQRIIPMRNQNEKIGVDVEVYLGMDYNQR